MHMAITSDVIKLRDCRLSFPRLFVPKSFQPGQPERYEASFLIDPTSKQGAKEIALICEQAESVLKQAFDGKVPKKIKLGFGYADGDPVTVGGVKFNSDVKEYDGYEGMFYIASNNRTRPAVVDRDRSPLVESDGKPYAGCYVNATITLWPQNNQFGQRVNANLRGVQFSRDGEAFGVKPVDADEEFDDIEDADDDDFLD